MLTKSAPVLAAVLAAVLACAAPSLAAAQDAGGRYGGGRWPAQDGAGRYGRGGYGGQDSGQYGRPGGYRRDDGDRGDRGDGGRYGRGRPGDEGPLYADEPGEARPNSLGRDWGEQQREAREGRMQGRFVPLAQVLSELGRRYPGRQLDAGLEQRGAGQTVYRVRWFGRDGRRIDFIVDARTGAVLGQEGR